MIHRGRIFRLVNDILSRNSRCVIRSARSTVLTIHKAIVMREMELWRDKVRSFLKIPNLSNQLLRRSNFAYEIRSKHL